MQNSQILCLQCFWSILLKYLVSTAKDNIIKGKNNKIILLLELVLEMRTRSSELWVMLIPESLHSQLWSSLCDKVEMITKSTENTLSEDNWCSQCLCTEGWILICCHLQLHCSSPFIVFFFPSPLLFPFPTFFLFFLYSFLFPLFFPLSLLVFSFSPLWWIFRCHFLPSHIFILKSFVCKR